ncbi:MAG TPA: SulP family inorganic anion transporter [Anaerolineales bacterium]|nr:SulP family inorganic anion transporter [Anaerolineales bacterium]
MGVIGKTESESRGGQWISGVTAGVISALVVISMEISLAALIWSGPLRQFLPAGIGLMLFGALVVGVLIALTSSLPGAVAIPQDTPAAILALVAAGIASAMSSSGSQAVYVTVVVALGLTSLLMALLFSVLGRFRASGFVRYIPYPVVGGFLAGTGFLIARGAFSVMLGAAPHLADIPSLFTADMLVMWLPGVVFAVALLLVLRRFHHSLITPLFLLIGIGIFYGLLFALHIPVEDALARGLMLGPMPASSLFRPVMPADLHLVDWNAILQEADKIATVLVLSVVALLLNTSALEVAFRRDIDLDRELYAAGLANLLGGLGGSPVGYQTLSMSAFTSRVGSKARLASVISGLLCGAALLFGATVISYVPKVVLGGVLLYLGLSFMVEWLIDARRSLPLVDYLLVWLILGIIVAFGFLQGIAAGVIIAVVVFVIAYSRVDIVRNTLDGRVLHSNVDRPQAHRELLARHGGAVYVLRLQGFIFFGTIQGVLHRVRSRLNDRSLPQLCYLVIDFQRVTQLDSSAVFGITRLKQLAAANGVWIVWTQFSPAIQQQMQRGDLVDDEDSLIVLPTLDHGMEWCENRILAENGITDLTGFVEPLEAQLKRDFPSLLDVSRLMKYLQRREVPEGEYLMHEGDIAADMYFVESGLVNVQLQAPDGQVMRLRTVGAGATVGEVGLYLGTVRSASVVASRPSAVYRLSANALKDMRAQDPEVAALLHEWIAGLLAERLAFNTRTIEALMD